MRFIHTSGDRPLDGYTIQRGLGRGGFGEVYQAISDGGKVVALKLVQRNMEVELRGVGQCLNLKHQNLVGLFDVHQTPSGDYWVVMELLTGETLDQVIARHPEGMPLEDVLAWLRGLCDGVGHLHQQGIVHRDLKPGNIFREEGIVKIGDYGLSKFISASRRSGQTGSVGTVHYMAPEVAGGRYGKELDLYAVGVILYEMLTGRTPFDGETPGEILMKHLTAAPDLSPVPLAFRPVVARLLNKDPYQRYSSVQAMLADLTGYLATPPETGEWQPVAPEAAAALSPPMTLSQRSAANEPYQGERISANPAGSWPFAWQVLQFFLGVGTAISGAVAVYFVIYYTLSSSPSEYDRRSNISGLSSAIAVLTFFAGIWSLVAWIQSRRRSPASDSLLRASAGETPSMSLATMVGGLVGQIKAQRWEAAPTTKPTPAWSMLSIVPGVCFAVGISILIGSPRGIAIGFLIFGGFLLLTLFSRSAAGSKHPASQQAASPAKDTPAVPVAVAAGTGMEPTGSWQPPARGS